MAQKRYTLIADYDRDDGAWNGSVTEIQGCHTHGRTLRQLENRMREAMSLYIPEKRARQAEFEFKLRGDGVSERLLEEHDQQLAQVEESLAGLAKIRKRLAARMTSHGIGTRDIGELLGLSHTRVSQILDNGSSKAATPKQR